MVTVSPLHSLRHLWFLNDLIVYLAVLAAGFAESRKLYAEYAEANENFRRIYDHWSAYWQKQQQWLRVAELPYDYFTSAQVGR